MSGTPESKETPRESPAESVLKRFRPPERARAREKKRRLSAGFLMVNLVMLTIFYVIYARSGRNDEYRSSAFTYRGINFRFSQTRDRETRDYIFYLTMKSDARDTIRIPFPAGLAEINVFHDETALLQMHLGSGVRLLTLKPGETNVQKETLGRDDLKHFALSHPEWITPRERSLLQFERSHIPLRAVLVIRDDRRMSTPLLFQYEVDR